MTTGTDVRGGGIPAADVAVIGGGPGGATAATMLARKGFRVVLFERERFPRHHVGESLLPASIPVLEELGAYERVRDAGFLPKYGATMVWGREKSPWSWYFRETSRAYPHSFQVSRPLFDSILLDNARSHGVDVRERRTVTGVLERDGVVEGVRVRAPDGATSDVPARFVVDASGQSTLLSRRFGLRQWDDYFRNLAVYAYYHGAHRLPPPDETNIFIESYAGGWLWTIPLHTGAASASAAPITRHSRPPSRHSRPPHRHSRESGNPRSPAAPGLASVGVVVDAAAGRDALREQDPAHFLASQIAQAPHTSAMLRDAALIDGPFVARDWSYVSERTAGDGFVLVGDAACFVDPLFSSGVHLAMMSGVLAAAYVTTALRNPAMREAAARVYEELYRKEYDHFRELARLFYSSNRTEHSYFWEARRLLDPGDALTPRQAFVRALAGQSPRGYERVALERGEPPADVVEGVRAVERARAERAARLSADSLTQDALLAAVPRLAPGTVLERKPIVAEGEFVWGHVLVTPDRPEGMPCSDLVGALVSRIDGRAAVADILAAICQPYAEAQRPQIAAATLNALRILYTDGAISHLHGL